MNIVVLGGGTAGWLTALFVNKVIPNSKVSIIQSKSVGIVGVGEATTPPIIPFLNYLDININDLLKKTGGTIKNGISFENWNGDGKRYFHGFMDKVSDFSIPCIFDSGCMDFYLKNVVNKNISLDTHTYTSLLSYKNRVDLNKTHYAIHFDTNLLSNYLNDIGKKRGVKIYEGVYTHCSTDENGNIKELHLEDNRSVECDFVFDCSGFARLLIGKHFKEQWVSYKDHLPMKKGLPFWVEPDKDIKPYTTATALKYGWVWNIPLQHRYGCGYIFDSDYVSDDEAIDEVNKHFNKKLDINRTLSFEAGRYKRFWIKNCMAVGLSSSFIEPLESTSILLTTEQLNTFRHFLNEIENPNLKSQNLFNEIVNNNMDDTLNFVYLHYLTKRKDSDFWKNLRDNYSPPPSFVETLEAIKENNLRYFDVNDTKKTTGFPLASYLMVCDGLGLFNKKSENIYSNHIPTIEQYKSMIDNLSIHAPNHTSFLNSL